MTTFLRLAISTAVVASTAVQTVWADTVAVPGRQDFEVLCAACHGISGRGDGVDAACLKTRPADLTQITRRNGGTYPQARVFDTIVGVQRPVDHGTGAMPVWGRVFVDEAVGGGVTIGDAVSAEAEVRQRIDALVAYIQTIQE